MVDQNGRKNKSFLYVLFGQPYFAQLTSKLSHSWAEQKIDSYMMYFGPDYFVVLTPNQHIGSLQSVTMTLNAGEYSVVSFC